jgi:hypothetical protein
MRDLGRSLAIACVLGCAGMRPAATAAGGPGGLQSQLDSCNVDCGGGGHGSLLVPLAVVGATALGIAAITLIYYFVLPDVRVTTLAPPP